MRDYSQKQDGRQRFPMAKEGNLNVQSLRANIGVRIHFHRPLLRWVEVPGRFFECIYSGVKDRHPGLLPVLRTLS